MIFLNSRITSGAKDKFIIEPDTGTILVSRGANLDPDLTVPTTKSYLLEITAFDQGVGDNKRYGKTHVNVTIGMYEIHNFKNSLNN